MPIIVIRSSTRSLWSTAKWVLHNGTHTQIERHTHTQHTYIATNRLNGTKGQSSEKRTALYRKITKNQIGKESIHCSHILEVLAARGVLAEWA